MSVQFVYMPGKWYKHLTAVQNLGPAVCSFSEEQAFFEVIDCHDHLTSPDFLGLSSGFITILLQAPMFFKLPFIAAVFALPVLASGSLVSLSVPPNVVVFSGKNDAYFTRIVSTLLADIPVYSFFSAQMHSKTPPYCQLMPTSYIHYWMVCLSLVRKHHECEGKCHHDRDCDSLFNCKCGIPDGETEGVSRVSILRRILYWHSNYSRLDVLFFRRAINQTWDLQDISWKNFPPPQYYSFCATIYNVILFTKMASSGFSYLWLT